MTGKPPDLRDLIGDDLPAGELERLGRVHELLVRAGPPPELPGDLAEAPEPEGTVALLPKRHWRPLAALAAALAIVAFGVGWFAAAARDSGRESFPPIEIRVPMAGTPAAPHAVASIAVAELDESGNWPLAMTIRGLPSGPNYELWLTRKGRLVALCGSFRTNGDSIAYMNAPYKLRQYDGWVVTRAGEQQFLLKTTKV